MYLRTLQLTPKNKSESIISPLPLLKPPSFLMIIFICKNCPLSCRAKRAFPSGETLILPGSRVSRYNTLHFAMQSCVPKGYPLETRFCRDTGKIQKQTAYPPDGYAVCFCPLPIENQCDRLILERG